jgi:hypothetical protein
MGPGPFINYLVTHGWIGTAYSGATGLHCMNWCDLVPSSNLVGVSVKNSGASNARCYCYFSSNGIPPEPYQTAYNPSVDEISGVHEGIGAVRVLMETRNFLLATKKYELCRNLMDACYYFSITTICLRYIVNEKLRDSIRESIPFMTTT